MVPVVFHGTSHELGGDGNGRSRGDKNEDVTSTFSTSADAADCSENTVRTTKSDKEHRCRWSRGDKSENITSTFSTAAVRVIVQKILS